MFLYYFLPPILNIDPQFPNLLFFSNNERDIIEIVHNSSIIASFCVLCEKGRIQCFEAFLNIKENMNNFRKNKQNNFIGKQHWINNSTMYVYDDIIEF